jgi:hypothetical protein
MLVPMTPMLAGPTRDPAFDLPIVGARPGGIQDFLTLFLRVFVKFRVRFS